MRTFLKYPGGKTKELDIINQNKPIVIKRYFEPFLGGGSVFFDLEIANSFINDKSEDLMALFAFVKAKDETFLELLSKTNEIWKNLSVENWGKVDFSYLVDDSEIFEFYANVKLETEKRRIQKSENSEDTNFDTALIEITSIKTAFYSTIRKIYNTSSPKTVVRTVCYYFLREFCYSSMFRFSSIGDFNVPYGGQSYNEKNFDTKIELITQYSMNKTKIYNEDFEVFLKRFTFNRNDFVFVDPPYDSEFSDYDGNEFDKDKQIILANMLSRIPANIMVVIKNTEFIYDLYSELGFKISSFDKKYSVNFQNRNCRDVKHLLITNY